VNRAKSRVVAVSVGRIAPLFGAKDSVPSAIRKTPVSTLENPLAVPVETLGIEGDEQADLRVHGGPNKAVYLYPVEHYPVWETMRHQALKVEQPLAPGFMGENLTIEGLCETEVYVGDRLYIGDPASGVVLAVTDPRAPCFKFNARMGFKHAAKMMVQSAYTGWYAAVFRPGLIKAGDSISVVAGERAIRVDERHRLMTGGKQDDLF
jgi:MOSC domain-containing protein YiiM